MFVDVQSLVLGWPDYVLFVGVLVLYATFRVLMYSKPFLRRHLRWLKPNERRWSLDDSEISTFTRVGDKQLSASLGTTTLIMFCAVYFVSTEAYGVGTQMLYLILAHVLAAVFMAHFYMPLFHELEMNNIYQYLEMRFNRCVGVLSTVSAFFHMLFQMAFILCIPALALAQMTAYPMWLAVLLTGLMAASYTGTSCFRLSLWVNAIQLLFGLIAPLVVLILGMRNIGGFNVMLSAIQNGSLNTLDNFQISPLKEYSFFTIVFGGFGVLLSILAINPIEVEQYSTTIRPRNAIIGVYVRAISFWLFFVLLFTCGLVGFTTFLGCNPKLIGLTSHIDQILVATVGIISENRVTLKGFFLGALCASSFGAMTSLANSVALMLTRDVTNSFIALHGRRCTPGGMSRWIAFMLCLVCVPISFGLLQIPTSLFRSFMTFAGALGGPLFTVTCLGMFFPWISNLGAITGLILSQLSGLSLLVFKICVQVTSGQDSMYHNSTKTCKSKFPLDVVRMNATNAISVNKFESSNFSFWYIPGMCFIVGLVTSLLMSLPAKFNVNNPVDNRYIAWPTRKIFNREANNDSNLFSDRQSNAYESNGTLEKNLSFTTFDDTIYTDSRF